MKNPSTQISRNLCALRRKQRYTLEEVAEKIGVTRQAVAKWENGETVPDIANCEALARLYDVTLDDLVRFDESERKMPIPPRGKHLFGVVKLGERGQIVLPKQAREVFRIQPGDRLVVLGDEEPGRAGIALMPEKAFLMATDFFRNMLELREEEAEEQKA